MPTRKNPFASGFVQNKMAKVVALFLALITWYAIKELISFEEEITDVPIEILVEDGWAILDRSENSVVVTFRGEREVVRNLDRDQVKLVVDIGGNEELGSMFVDLDPENVVAPNQVRAVGVEPSTLYLSLDQEGQRTVSVKPGVIQGQLPDGYELESAVCKPDTVQLFGPRRKLDEILEVKTDPVDLAGRLGSFKLRVPITSQSDSWVARVNPPYVQVEVTIVERSATREFTNVPVMTLRGNADRLALNLSLTNAMVVVAGRNEVLETLSPQSVRAYVDCEGLLPNTTNLIPVRVHVPHRVELQQVEPTELAVTVAAEVELNDEE